MNTDAYDQSDEILAVIREYAAARAKDVARGAETPALAGLLVQKFGLGAAELSRCLGKFRMADRICMIVDEEVSKIDPDWRSHARERWNMRPADVQPAK